MSAWQEHDIEGKLVAILRGGDFDSGQPDHHLGQPYVTVYQLASAFAQRHKDTLTEMNMDVGGVGQGGNGGSSMASYLARMMSQSVLNDPNSPFEGVWLSSHNLVNLHFRHNREIIQGEPNPDSKSFSLFRLKARP